MKEEKGFLRIKSVVTDNDRLFKGVGAAVIVIAAVLLALRVVPWWSAAEVSIVGVFMMLPIRKIALDQIVPTTVRVGANSIEVEMEDIMFDPSNTRNESYRFSLEGLEVHEEDGVITLYGDGYVRYSYRRRNRMAKTSMKTAKSVLLGRVPENIVELLPKQAS